MHYDTLRVKFFCSLLKFRVIFLIPLTLLNTNMTKPNCLLAYLYYGRGD